MVFLYQSQHLLLGRLLRGVALRYLNDTVVENVTRCVHHSQLAARTITGVQSQYHMTGKRRLQEQLFKVSAEDMNCLRFSAFRQLRTNLALQRWKEQPFIAVRHSEAQRLGKARRLLQNTTIDSLAVCLMIRLEVNLETALLLTSVDGQHAMGRQCTHRLLVIVVHKEGPAILCLFVQLGDDNSRLPQLLAHLLTKCRFLHNRLSHDILGACQCILRCGNTLFLIDEIRRHIKSLPHRFLLGEHRLRQRRETTLPCNLRTGTFLLLVGKVYVLQLLELLCLSDGFPKLVRHLPLFLNLRDNLLLPLHEVAKIRHPLLHRAHLLLVQLSRRLFTVT